MLQNLRVGLYAPTYGATEEQNLRNCARNTWHYTVCEINWMVNKLWSQCTPRQKRLVLYHKVSETPNNSPPQYLEWREPEFWGDEGMTEKRGEGKRDQKRSGNPRNGCEEHKKWFGSNSTKVKGEEKSWIRKAWGRTLYKSHRRWPKANKQCVNHQTGPRPEEIQTMVRSEFGSWKGGEVTRELSNPWYLKVYGEPGRPHRRQPKWNVFVIRKTKTFLLPGWKQIWSWLILSLPPPLLRYPLCRTNVSNVTLSIMSDPTSNSLLF